MTLSFLRGAKKRDQVISIDLGARMTKAVHLQRQGERYALTRYALMDTPICEKTLSSDMLAEHVRSICEALETKARFVTMAIGVNECTVRHTELPPMPVRDMRQVLKISPKTYLTQDMPGHLFDCYIIPPRGERPADEKNKYASSPKVKVLTAGARKCLIEDTLTALKANGMIADSIMPGLVGPINAFESAMPEVFSRELVALVDFGFRSTTICILQQGELILSRVVPIGGDQLTSGLADAMGISYAEAEGIKVGMPAEVQSHMEGIIRPLGHELRASIAFFENQHDKTVSNVFVSGATSRSATLMQMLQNDLMVEAKPWNPLGGLGMALPPQQMAEVDTMAPLLSVAVGVGLAAF